MNEGSLVSLISNIISDADLRLKEMQSYIHEKKTEVKKPRKCNNAKRPKPRKKKK